MLFHYSVIIRKKKTTTKQNNHNDTRAAETTHYNKSTFHEFWTEFPQEYLGSVGLPEPHDTGKLHMS